jgi:T5SS/PEP-CTERM-associated repeat protein
LLVTNGATLATPESIIGFNLGAISNSAIVAGPGSRWIAPGEFEVGLNGAFNSLTVSDGGWLVSGDASIGLEPTSSNNAALVTGAGTVWSNLIQLAVGFAGPGNRLQISNGGTVFASDLVLIGTQATSSNNLLHVLGGTLRAQNASGTGRLDIRSGTNRLDAGLVDVDRLTITNARGFFEFNGGTLRTTGTTIGTGQIFDVGNGADAATLELRGGTHVFLGGLVVANHAMLTGNGSVPSGLLTVQAGGSLAPGAPIGALAFNVSPVLLGATIMEISKSGATLTNDRVQVVTTLSYGGSLTVTNIGPDALIAGSRFLLFSAASFAGSFATITLPPLGPGLAWMNNLSVDGSMKWSSRRSQGLRVLPCRARTSSSPAPTAHPTPPTPYWPRPTWLCL